MIVRAARVVTGVLRLATFNLENLDESPDFEARAREVLATYIARKRTGDCPVPRHPA